MARHIKTEIVKARQIWVIQTRLHFKQMYCSCQYSKLFAQLLKALFQTRDCHVAELIMHFQESSETCFQKELFSIYLAFLPKELEACRREIKHTFQLSMFLVCREDHTRV
jgi:hypothetical protein